MTPSVGWRKSLCQLQLKPDYTEAFSLLSHLDTEELQLILCDDKNCDDIIKDLKQVKEIEDKKEILTVSNRSLAEFNLARKPHLTNGKQRIQELSEEGENICKTVETKCEELTKHDKIQTTLDKLKTAVDEAEEESESIVSKFLDGEIDVAEFLQLFFPCRKLVYLRRINADKLSEMAKIRKLLSSPFRRVRLPSSEASSDYQTPPNSEVPYPIDGVNPMPMPSNST